MAAGFGHAAVGVAHRHIKPIPLAPLSQLIYGGRNSGVRTVMRQLLVVAFLVGVVIGYPKVQYAWNGDGTPINISYLAEWGFGFAFLAVAIWGVVRLIKKVAR
jgi:hypothetical protein